MRRLALVALLTLTVPVLSACNRSGTTAVSERTLASFEPYLTRSLTPAAIRAQFGPPDDITGSGLLIYHYRIDGSRAVVLAFPGEAPIVYARLKAADGTLSDLMLR